jgi:hypothetical protein
MENLRLVLLPLLRENPWPTKNDTFHGDGSSFFSKKAAVDESGNILIFWTGECQGYMVLL